MAFILGALGLTGKGSVSKSTTNVATKSVVDAVTKNIMNCSVGNVVKQSFIISGNYNVLNNVKQVQYTKVNAQCYQKAENIDNLQQLVKDAIKQASDAQNVALLGAFSSSSAINDTAVNNDVQQYITKETITNVVNKSNQQQEIIISGNNNIVNNFSQEQTFDVVYSNVQDLLNQMSTIQALETTAQNESKSTQTNSISELVDSLGSAASSILDSTGSAVLKVWIIPAIVAVVAIIYLGPLLLKGGPLVALLGDDEKVNNGNGFINAEANTTS